MIWKILVRLILFWTWKLQKKCDGIFLDQSHYVEKILRKYNFYDHKSVTTPFDSSVHLFPVNNDDEIFNQKDYISIIGSLRYVTDCTRPDIAYEQVNESWDI